MAYVGNSGRVWRKVPESNARNVLQHITLIQNASFTVRSMTRDWSKRVYVSAATTGHDSVTWQPTWHAARAVWSSISIPTLKDTSLVQKMSMSQPAATRYLLRSRSQTARYLLRFLSQTARGTYLDRCHSQQQLGTYLDLCHKQLGTYLDLCHKQLGVLT